MANKELYDISEVCKSLGITSRTLRFYEEKGIIKSTTIGTSSRRQYTEEQVSHIKNVLILRTLGIPIKSILALQNENTDLKETVLSKRAEIYASIETKVREIHLLTETLSALEAGKDIFQKPLQYETKANEEEKQYAMICTQAILDGNSGKLYEYFSPRMQQYLPQNVYEIIRKDSFLPLGDFISIDKMTADEKLPGTICQFVKFSKLGLKITFVFCDRQIEGLWLGYYDPNEQ